MLEPRIGFYNLFSPIKVGLPVTEQPTRRPLRAVFPLAELCESGKMAPVIDREYSFEEVIDAIQYVATKRARGKVVVNIAKADQSCLD